MAYRLPNSACRSLIWHIASLMRHRRVHLHRRVGFDVDAIEGADRRVEDLVGHPWVRVRARVEGQGLKGKGGMNDLEAQGTGEGQR
eukprot:3779437-Prymnesium_polylepis.1